jgi:peptidoglycan/LPS O-acetylase OafA/YrhL
MNNNNYAPKNTPHSSHSNRRLSTFDFLRGLAILGVIAVHTSQIFPSKISIIDSIFGFGAKGVQLFYFISALTMCYMWKQREGESNPIQKFYIRRFFRIAPLFWLAIPIYLYINGLGASYFAPEGIGTRQILLTATFLHGFWPDSINSVVPGGWSIAVEMTFYALFPFLITSIKDNKKIYLYAAVVVWAFNIFIFRDLVVNFLSMHYSTTSTSIVKDYLYLNFVNQAPIFLIGCYLFFALNSKVEWNEIVFILSWLAISLIIKILFNIEGSGFSAFYLLLGTFVFACVKYKVKFKLFELLGKNSYAIYLTHFLVLHYLQKSLPLKNGLIAFLLGITATIILSYLLSIFTYIIIEKRVQFLISVITRSKQT